MTNKNKEILDYLQKQHETQIGLLKTIDAKVANILVTIIGDSGLWTCPDKWDSGGGLPPIFGPLKL